MAMKIILLLAISLCAHALDIKMESETDAQKDKRQTQDELVHAHLLYRPSRKQEQGAPVEENQEEDKNGGRDDDYRPGQVFSLNAQELLELQPERKAPLPSGQQLQQLYSNPQPEQKQNLQQFYYIEPQSGRQVSLQPSHAVIARPHYSANGGEASVGAALSVSDGGVSPSHAFDPDLLTLLGHPGRQEEPRQSYAQPQHVSQVTTHSNTPTYQQVDRYITKPNKKPTKLRSKVQIAPPQLPSAPQQYLIETTNVQQQQQATHQQQYHAAPQNQRPQLRYVPIQQQISIQQYEGPESQGLKVVPPPKLQQLQQPHPQLAYRLQYQQAEASPKQYRIVEAPRVQQQSHRVEQGRSVVPERPVTYLKRYPEPEKLRAVKIYDQAVPEALPSVQQQAHVANDQYYLRPVYKSTEPTRYDLQQFARAINPTKPPLSAIYVSKNVAPKKVLRPILRVDQGKLDQPHGEHVYRIAQPSNLGQQQSQEQHGQNVEDQRPHLPPPRNNKAYTPEEFAALVAAGYSVTPVPVGPNNHQVAQSRSLVEPSPQPHLRRPVYNRRHQYLPLRSDEAP
ncbi:uncharacterized protein [Epargyreus clarus]|uniref:uncharacterized protein n=1 Tax=Epargyreus clarus TaxID=520877 RepID=UPI003C2F7FCD